MSDYVGVVVCGTRRAAAWKKAFAQAGIEAKIAETIGEESENGAFKVSVPRRDLPKANDMITAVTRGEARLPGEGFTPMTAIAIVVIAALIAALVLRG